MQFVIYVAATKEGGWAYDVFGGDGKRLKTENGKRWNCRYCEGETVAALNAISWGMEQGCNNFIVVTSMKYLADGAMKWRWKWKKNDWITKEGLELEAKDMWIVIDKMMEITNVEWCFDNDDRLHRLRALAKCGK
jgi:ribonuclease HI